MSMKLPYIAFEIGTGDSIVNKKKVEHYWVRLFCLSNGEQMYRSPVFDSLRECIHLLTILHLHKLDILDRTTGIPLLDCIKQWRVEYPEIAEEAIDVHNKLKFTAPLTIAIKRSRRKQPYVSILDSVGNVLLYSEEHTRTRASIKSIISLYAHKMRFAKVHLYWKPKRWYDLLDFVSENIHYATASFIKSFNSHHLQR